MWVNNQNNIFSAQPIQAINPYKLTTKNNVNRIIDKLIWIDAKVNNSENKGYQKILKEKYNLKIETYETADQGIDALENIQFESIFVITSGTIYPEFFGYMKRTYEELRVIPFSIIFTSSKQNFIEKHKNDQIGKIYNKTFFNRGGVVDIFDDVLKFINEIYYVLDNFKICNKYENIFTKNYSGLIVFETVTRNIALPDFYIDIYKNKKIDFSLLNNFTIFFLKNFCTKAIEKLLKPLVLFKEVPEVIISKWWARIYTYETPFYSIMNKSLMRKNYKEYEVYIKLLYRGLACNSYRPKYSSNLIRGTKLELSEINYLKSISGTDTIIFNKSFLSFSLNKYKSIAFQSNCERFDPNIINEPKQMIIANNNKEDNNMNVLIEVHNIDKMQQYEYIMSNALLADISCYSKEEEVLIFPFTGFEVTHWENFSCEDEDGNLNEGTNFHFQFSKKYYKMIKAKYK